MVPWWESVDHTLRHLFSGHHHGIVLTIDTHNADQPIQKGEFTLFNKTDIQDVRCQMYEDSYF